MPAPEILVVEDDPEMVDVLREGLMQVGYSVAVATDGCDGLRIAQEHRFSAIVLDVLLPALDGFEIATELRREGNPTPILMLTAKSSIADVVHGLDVGAEDYVTKPFSFLELSARLRALIRRSQPVTSSLRAGDLVMDVAACRVTRGTHKIQLTPIQFKLLAVLMRADRQIVRRRDIVDEVWGAGTHVEENTLDAAIASLRAILDKGQRRRLIQTVRGFGYRLDA